MKNGKRKAHEALRPVYMGDAAIAKIAARDPARGSLLEAVKKAGGASRLAKAINALPGAQRPAYNGAKGSRRVTHQAVCLWLRGGRCPDIRAAQIEACTGVPASRLTAPVQ